MVPSRFVDRDAFARFAGIGIGCQRLQASQVLDIQIGPDYTVVDPGQQSASEGRTGSRVGGSDNDGSDSDGSGGDDLGFESE